MKDAVLIKSFPNGITLLLNEEAAMEQILDELSYKFSEARNFFGKASVALSIEGRQLSDVEEIRIVETIRANSQVQISCLVGHDEETGRMFLKALQRMEQKFTSGDEGQFYKGSLKNREVLETENSIVVLGDVYPGAAVISTRNIIILGGLYGEAYAGGNGDSSAYVVALEMEPERLKIGDFKYKTNDRRSKWSIRPKVQPKIAYVKNNSIVLEALTKDLLSSF